MSASKFRFFSVLLGVAACSVASAASAQCPVGPAGPTLVDIMPLVTACTANGYNVIIGTSGVDALNGTGGADCIFGLGGTNVITANRGDDCVYGGPDQDIISGGAGADFIWGGDGDDVINGNGGADTIFGDGGDDVLRGDGLADTIDGGSGNDTILGGAGVDTLRGGLGNDTINGEGSGDIIFGDDGDDNLFGDTGNDNISGGNGNDTIRGGNGDDVIDGGDGDDQLFGEDQIDTIQGGLGADTIDGGSAGDTINGGDGNDTLLGGTGTGIDIINGDAGDDTIQGGDGADILSGGLGNDTIDGEAGNDTINGGDGDDVLNGGNQNDTIHGDGGADRIFGNDGVDTLFGDAGTDLIFGGAGNDIIRGGSENDTLHGDDGNDNLFGEGGRDNLFGGAGQDGLDGGTENDYCNSGVQVDLMNNTSVGSGTGPPGPAADGDTFTACEALLTYATIGAVDAVTVGGRPTLRFTTNTEAGTQGFEIYRREGDALVAVGPALVPALLGAPQGGTYFVADGGLRVGSTYHFVEVEVDGDRHVLGDWTVTAAGSADVSLVDGLAAVPHSPVATAVVAPKAGDEPEGPAVALYLGVDESGVYRVTMTQVAAALSLSLADAQALLASRGLALSVEGQPVAWWSEPGTDALYFYGQARDSMYLADNLYRLELGDGVVVGQRDATAVSGGEGATSDQEVRAERDVAAVTVMNPDANRDFWFWQGVARGVSADFPVSLRAPTGTGRAQLTFELHGASTRAGVTDEHQANVLINGTLVGSFAFEGMVPRVITVDVDAALLVDGTNTVRLTGTGAAHSVIWVDAVSARYTRSLADVGGAVSFSAVSAGAILLEGVSANDVRVLDVSNPRAPTLLQGLDVVDEGGSFSVRLAGEAAARYVAVTGEGVRVPRLVRDYPSDLRHAQGAEYVVIAPRALFSGARALADYRNAQGLTSTLVDVTDIYDEFAYGTPDPHAIRDFLHYATEHWATPPRYVVLAGAGTLDYMNVSGLNGNLVPALMVNTANGLYASDTAFADFNDDGRPELLLGRLPVTNNDALEAFVDRLATYEEGLPGQTDRTLFLADGSDSTFDAATDALTSLVNALSDAGLVEQLYRSNMTLDLARTRLFAALEEGVFWVNYTGHGALNSLASDGLLTAADVPTLTAAELPIFTTMTCTTSRFELAGFESLGEALSNSNVAIGVWGASGLSAEEQAQPMLQGFTRGLYGDARTLGEAIDGAYEVLAARPGGTRDMFAIYNLLGDPATRLKDRHEQDIITPPTEDAGVPAADAGSGRPLPPAGDAGVTVDLGGGQAPATGGGMGGGACAASGQPGQGASLYLLVLALVGLRARRRVG